MEGLKCFSLCFDGSGKRKASEIMGSVGQWSEEQKQVDGFLHSSSLRNGGGISRHEEEGHCGSDRGESGRKIEG
jgi:hypothetical protein